MLVDPIADMLTRIRNGVMAQKSFVEIPASGMKLSIARIMKEEGFIKKFSLIKDRKQGILRVELKYDSEMKPVLLGLERVSKPSRRVYVSHDKIPRVLNGLGVAIISTSKGVMTDREARAGRVGGEHLVNLW